MIKRILGIIAFFALYCLVGTIESTDHFTGWILESDGLEVTVETENGNIYSFFGDEFLPGEKVELTIFNGGNINPSDDVVVNVTPVN